MIKRRIIATKINITRQGEIKFFQVKIPFDAKTLIGIETAVRIRSFKDASVGMVPVLGQNPYGNITGTFAAAGASVLPVNGAIVINGASALSPAPPPAIIPPGVTPSPTPDGVPMKRVGNSFVGELKLQSCDDSNVFYATDIYDRSVNEVLDRALASSFFENVWTYGYERKIEKIRVDGNATVIAGIYKDKFGAMLGRDISYDVFLYIWYKYESEINNRQEKSNDNKPCA